MQKYVEIVSKEIKKNIKKYKINAEIFIGGSFAKKTVIKKENYDVDFFIRYDKKYKSDEITLLTKKILKGNKNISVVHGSRDYFKINFKNNFFIEVIPVRKINNPKDYENITDLSYLHVKYINKKVKSPKVLEEIKLAKAFCYANNCYGAESYISGFSGYSLELLVYHYKTFDKFIKAMVKIGKDKKIIDPEKKFKNKKNVLLDLNSSKLISPVILIDPTYHHRNVLAALSEETFRRFQKACKTFIKNPSLNSFEIKKINLNKIQADALKKKKEFILMEAKTSKPEGGVAGSKLLKFYNYLQREIELYFNVKNKGFNYNGQKSARYFFVAERKKEIIYSGPFSKDKENSKKFRKEHKKVFDKKGRLYAKSEINFKLDEFIQKWKKKNARIIKEMYITDFRDIK